MRSDRVFTHLIFALAVLFAAPHGSQANGVERPENSVVGSIDKEPVFREEYRLFFQRARPVVYARLQNTRQTETRDLIPESANDGQIPTEAVRSEAIDQLLRARAQLKVCQEIGVLSSTDWAAFTSEWNAENERRRKTLEARGVIYGPEQYRQDVFYSIRLGNLRHAAERELEKRYSTEGAEPHAHLRRLFDKEPQRFAGRTFEEVKKVLIVEAARADFQARIQACLQRMRLSLDTAALDEAETPLSEN